MDVKENVGTIDELTDIIVSLPEAWAALKPDKQYWVEYCACQGIRFGQDGSVNRMTITECASLLGVNDNTLRRWKKDIDRFQEFVSWRRSVIYSDKVVSSAWTATALKAAKGDDAAVERILTNFDPKYKSPKQTHELEIGDNLAEIFGIMRKEAQIIDGDYTESDSRAEIMDGTERATDIPSQP